MRILLLGEFSGLHKNLKEGLRENGYDVTHASNGDGWKKVDSDITWFSSKKGVKNWIKTLFSLITLIPKLKGYDVVQIVSPVLFPRHFGINKFLVRFIFKHNKKVFLVGAGASSVNSYIADFYERDYKYPQLYKAILGGGNTLWAQTLKGRKYNDWLHSRITGYIPIMYEYAQCYRNINYDKLCRTIPIPINTDKIQFSENIINKKIVIFHGLIREEQKGTPLIKEALERIQIKYPNDVEVIIDGNLPLNEYLEIIHKVNIVIDQVYSVSNGVNAIYNLAMGNVVLGGGEAEALSEFNLEKHESPLIPIDAYSSDIENKLISLIERKDELKMIGKKSREYVEMLHDYKIVANQYMDEWSKF